ncbi:MAG: response regulator [Planctomyces sp.]|nr:response regulator [Planctomyces sp.]
MDQHAAPAKQRIVVIDDSRDARRTCQLLLARLGHEVRTAEDATTGLELCREFQPHSVLCDISLPGMDGYEFARTVRQDPELSRVRLIAQTGHGLEDDIARSKAAGFDLHLTKPVDFTVLMRVFSAGSAGASGQPG